MTLTPEQINRLAIKKELIKFPTKHETDEIFGRIFEVLDVILKKLDNIENNLIPNCDEHAIDANKEVPPSRKY